jgi:DNA-binding NarL/FixJ family response regulator
VTLGHANDGDEGVPARKSVAGRTGSAARVCDDSCVATTVVIVDDHPSFRATARAVLEAEGYEVVGEAADAASALALVEEIRPELVLLDVQLPDGTGFGVAQALTRNGTGPSVVLTSSRDASDFGPLVAASGAVGFIAKADLSGAALAALLL